MVSSVYLLKYCLVQYFCQLSLQILLGGCPPWSDNTQHLWLWAIKWYGRDTGLGLFGLSSLKLGQSALGSIIIVSSGAWSTAKTPSNPVQTGLATDLLPKPDYDWLSSGVLNIIIWSYLIDPVPSQECSGGEIWQIIKQALPLSQCQL